MNRNECAGSCRQRRAEAPEDGITMSPTIPRHIHRHEWLHAWHYARYDRRHGQISDFVGPLLRQAARAVMHQGRDVLAARASMQGACGKRTALLYTTAEFRAGLAKATGEQA